MHELTKRYAIPLFISFFIVSLAQAQVQPELTAVFPQGGQQGTTVDITLKGKNVGTATVLWFSGSGVTAEIQEKTGEAAVFFNGAGVTGHIPNDASLTATVTIAPDAPLGIQQVRIVTPYGVSNALSFVVGELPEIIEDGTADNWLELPITVNGDIASIDDEDTFRFSLKKDARLICDVTAQRMGSLLDSYLVLKDAAGTEVANSGMGSGFDSLLDYTAETAGNYTLYLRDIRYKGGEGYGYRLRIGELPYLETIFPLGGRRGSENTIAVSGANLEPVESIQISIGAETPTGEQSLRVRTPAGLATNAHPFAIGNLAEMAETEPNDMSENTNAVTVPITLNGKIEKAGDVDMFSFEVADAQRLVFEVEALTLSSRLDALLTLYAAVGGNPAPETAVEKMEAWGKKKEARVLAVNDDARGADARIEWLFEEAGTYSVSVRDLNEQGGENYPYRLSIRPLAPDCELSVVVLDNRNRVSVFDNPRVSRGSSVTMQVNVTRLDGFNGLIRLTCPELPKTFNLSHTIVEPEQNRALLTVTAPWDAPLGLMPLSIIGVCAVGSKQIERTATPEPVLLTVMDAPAFTLSLAEIGLDVIHNKSVDIHVTANRLSGFVGPIALSVGGLPTRVTAAPVTIAEGETEATLSIKAGSFERREQFSVVPMPGTTSISVTGTATINSVPVKQSTPAIPLTIVEAPFIVTVEPLRFSIVFPQTTAGLDASNDTVAIANAPSKAEDTNESVPTKEAMLTLTVVRQGGFTDAVTLTPMDLPEGITTSIATIPANETEVEVPLQALASLKPDTYTFKFRGSATINGKLFAQDSPLLSVKIIH